MHGMPRHCSTHTRTRTPPRTQSCGSTALPAVPSRSGMFPPKSSRCSAVVRYRKLFRIVDFRKFWLVSFVRSFVRSFVS